MVRTTAAAAAAAKSLQSCLTLCDPIDGSPPGSPIVIVNILTGLIYFPTCLLFLESFYPCYQLFTQPCGGLSPINTFSYTDLFKSISYYNLHKEMFQMGLHEC